MALLRLIHLGKFSRIELVYLVPGHSYMATDRKFGNVATAKKHKANILSPDDLEAVVQSARVYEKTKKKGKQAKLKAKEPFKTHRITYKDVLHVETLTQTNSKTRHILIRKTKDKIFQKASIIMVKDSSPNGYWLKKDFQMPDKDATFIECRTPEDKNNNKVLNLGAVDLGRKYTHQQLMDETKLTHINEQVSEAMYGVTRKEPEPGETNWAIELKKEQERLKLLIPQKVQEVTVTESNVSEEEVEDVSED